MQIAHLNKNFPQVSKLALFVNVHSLFCFLNKPLSVLIWCFCLSLEVKGLNSQQIDPDVSGWLFVAVTPFSLAC